MRAICSTLVTRHSMSKEGRMLRIAVNSHMYRTVKKMPLFSLRSCRCSETMRVYASIQWARLSSSTIWLISCRTSASLRSGSRLQPCTTCAPSSV